MTTAEASAYLGVAVSTLEGWRQDGQGPPFVKYGRAVRYHRTDLEAFEAAHKFRNTAEASEAAS